MGSFLAYLRGLAPPPDAAPSRVAQAVAACVSVAYVCRGCDVYGVTRPGEDSVCWCCGTDDRLARRS